MPNENIVRPAISSVIRCIASRRSTGPPTLPCSFAIVSSVTATMCGTSDATARGVKAGASVLRWYFQARPSAISRPSPSIGRNTRRPTGVRV
jgi:hypothetical protein